MTRRLLLPLLMLLAAPAVAAADFLPPEPVALGAITHHPIVLAATADVRKAEADARALARGSHELELNVIPQRRETTGGPTFHEYEGQLQRAFRLPGKARLDRAIGQTGSRVATLNQADAEHHVARELLLAWMEWLRSGELEALARTERDLLERDRIGIARRVELGDAAQRDLDLADAALAQARARLAAATGAHRDARLALGGGFPDLPLPERVAAIPAPGAPDSRDSAGLIISRSHEIAAAEGEALQLRQQAQRARAERVGDPTLGLRYLNERGGQERVLGVVLSFPLGTGSRSARAQAQQAAADAGDARAQAMQRQIATEARQLATRTGTAYTHWQEAAAALAAMRESARKTRRAHELGEVDTAELILAERLQQEAATAELTARSDAVASALLVRIDTHELWHVEGEDDVHHEDHAGP